MGDDMAKKTASRDWREDSAAAWDYRLPYLVQFSDGMEQFTGRTGFDFGGEGGGVAAFASKGDAINFAIELNRRDPNRSARVINLRAKGKEEFLRRGKWEAERLDRVEAEESVVSKDAD